MKYSQAVKLLENYVNSRGIKPGLERIKKLLKLLDSPEQKVPVIHVAGTNGKGSVTMMCTNALLECGYKVGTFLSPHLVRYNERFLFQGKEISDQEFTNYFVQVINAAKKVKGVTEFEILTAMVFLFFRDKNVDVAVMEVGLGGRFDSTNICRAILTLITPIEIDHEDILGSTLARIATEKAGTLKKGVPAVISDQKPEVLRIILDRAEKLEVAISVVNHPIKFKLDMLGDYQRYNAALVVEGLRRLIHYQIYIPRRLIFNGIMKTRMPGRLEIISKRPLLILDAGHNPHSFANMFESIKKEYPFRPIVLALGLMHRKNLTEILKIIGPNVHKLIAVGIKASDAYTAKEIADKANNLLIKNVETADSLKSAIKSLKEQKNVNIIAGSFRLAGEFYKMRKRK